MSSNQSASSAKKFSNTSKFKPPRPSSTSGRAVPVAEDASQVRDPITSTTDSTTKIPTELLNRLLRQFFEDEQTKISHSASVLVGRYMEIFVKEALARAKIERKESNAGSDAFLEVSNAPYMHRRCNESSRLRGGHLPDQTDMKACYRWRTWRSWRHSYCWTSEVGTLQLWNSDDHTSHEASMLHHIKEAVWNQEKVVLQRLHSVGSLAALENIVSV